MQAKTKQLVLLQDFINIEKMYPKQLQVRLSRLSEIKLFIETWHYSHYSPNSQLCFKLLYRTLLIGAMSFGPSTMPNVWKKYVDVQTNFLEMHRLCCIDAAPSNTESYFIGKAIRWIKNNTRVKKIIAYADPAKGHNGTIYRATNFRYHGLTQPSTKIHYNGKNYHEKSIRDRLRNGTLSPIAKNLRQALITKQAKRIKIPAKHIFIYEIQRKKMHPMNLTSDSKQRSLDQYSF